ncbi:hypothetical protein [Nocardioides speluncae]|uniref:SWIM zinc finger family protein n=1 Tax=Nocardioides speluncae TaxID=2670337 RepID=UPI000D69871D|nr:hypothetical protein [Nocardioides speluncae]
MSAAVTYPRFAPRRSGARAASWWAKAWVRSVEESAFAEADLRQARALARAGAVGGLTLDAGSAVAAVAEGDDAWTVSLTLPVLEPGARRALVEVVAAAAGRVAALLSGQLPHELVEDLEESGVELLPYGAELETSCSCDAWMQPCPHALAASYQVGWLLDGDPLVLLLLRGLSREQLLADLHDLDQQPAQPGDDDLEVGVEAALSAQAMLEDSAVGPRPAMPST